MLLTVTVARPESAGPAASKELSVKRSRTHDVDRPRIAAASATLTAACRRQSASLMNAWLMMMVSYCVEPAPILNAGNVRNQTLRGQRFHTAAMRFARNHLSARWILS